VACTLYVGSSELQLASEQALWTGVAAPTGCTFVLCQHTLCYNRTCLLTDLPCCCLLLCCCCCCCCLVCTALKGPNLMTRDYPPAFPLKHQQKDLRLALALG
jgi:hypothetical protein